MSFLQEKPIFPADVLSVIYGIHDLPRHDGLALSSVTRMTRLVSLPFLFSSVTLNTKCKNALENENQALFNSIRSISTGDTTSPWPQPAYFTPMLRLFPKLLNLRSICLCRTILPLQLLPAFLASITSLPLHELLLGIDTASAPNSIDELPTAPPTLEVLRITWGNLSDETKTPDPITDASGFLRALVEPSVGTLQHLKVTFEYKQSATMSFDFGVLKAARALRSFSLSSYGDNADFIDDVLPDVLSPSLNALSLEWHSYPGTQPMFKESFVASLAQLPNLATLILGLDFEKDAKDTLRYDHDFGWYVRCLLRRLRATELLAAACPALETVVWRQSQIDSEGNNMNHAFRVGAGGAVRIVKDWWMDDLWKDERGLPLPDNIDDVALDRIAMFKCYGI
ncbi:hypothetical protein Hypma_009456 [Hypsizygus marmoreus]|uniref:F-box domain-containing protein n=1 Tax=Hypsizygus marmoreus TaxID=39966 RepID=A0A369JMI0_HYPMA|nr:hypothetical protein Hypma_009456 [Hypsizygus marmoreus]